MKSELSIRPYKIRFFEIILHIYNTIFYQFMWANERVLLLLQNSFSLRQTILHKTIKGIFDQWSLSWAFAPRKYIFSK